MDGSRFRPVFGPTRNSDSSSDSDQTYHPSLISQPQQRINAPNLRITQVPEPTQHPKLQNLALTLDSFVLEAQSFQPLEVRMGMPTLKRFARPLASELLQTSQFSGRWSSSDKGSQVGL